MSRSRASGRGGGEKKGVKECKGTKEGRGVRVSEKNMSIKKKKEGVKWADGGGEGGRGWGEHGS